jgi:hypothetical protein
MGQGRARDNGAGEKSRQDDGKQCFHRLPPNDALSHRCDDATLSRFLQLLFCRLHEGQAHLTRMLRQIKEES